MTVTPCSGLSFAIGIGKNYELVIIPDIFHLFSGPDEYPLPDPTRTFFLPEPDPDFFQNFRVQGGSYNMPLLVQDF